MEDKLISALRYQIDSLHNRIKDLEIENANLVSQIAHCCCSKVETLKDSGASNGVLLVEETKVLQEKLGKSKKKKSQGWNSVH